MTVNPVVQEKADDINEIKRFEQTWGHDYNIDTLASQIENLDPNAPDAGGDLGELMDHMYDAQAEWVSIVEGGNGDTDYSGSLQWKNGNNDSSLSLTPDRVKV